MTATESLLMLHRATILLLTYALAACGSDDSDDNPLDGTWITRAPGPDECFISYWFDNNQYENNFVCVLEDERFAIEAEVGSFDASNGAVTFVPESSTCPDASADSSDYQYEFVNGRESLQLVADSWVLILDRVEDDGMASGGAVAVFGCFDADRRFTEHPQHTL